MKPLRLGFNARLLRDPALRGWNRYAVNLLEALAEVPELELTLYSDCELAPAHVARLEKKGKPFALRIREQLPYLAWEQAWLPAQLWQDRIDVFHSPFHFGLPSLSHCPRVITLHDAIDDAYTSEKQGLSERFSPRALRARAYPRLSRARATQVITVSEFSKRDLVRHYGISPDRISVTPEAADPGFRPPLHGSVPATRSFLYVGGWERRKNLPFLLRAFAAAVKEGLPPDVRLTLAGDASNTELPRLARELGVAERVDFTGWVDDSQLPALYAGALAFVYPSEYEGFGLQLCEAMAMGCPTLAAAATSLPEVLGNGGETFRLDDPRELVALLLHVAREPSFGEDLRARALRRAQDFSWRKTADQTLAIYRAVTRS